MNNTFSIREGLSKTWLPIIEAEIENHHVNLIIDTGSTHSVLDEGIAATLKDSITYVGENSLHGIEGNRVNVQEGLVYLNINGEQYQQAFSFMSLGEAFTSIKEESGIEVHGLLGNNFLVNNRWIIDYGKFVIATALEDCYIEGYEQYHIPQVQMLNMLSGRELVLQENSTIDFINAGDKYIFRCGKVEGEVSTALKEAVQTVTLEEVQYVEVSYNGNEAVPTLMLIKGNSLL